MRRVSLTLLSTLAVLIMSAMPLPAAALGDVQVKLGCSDGSTTDLTVDSATLAELQDAVEAMTLYPADLSCTLGTTPLLGSFGASVAEAAGATDFVVGGGQRAFCDFNIAVNGHSQAGVPLAAWGAVNETIPENASCGFEGILRTEVVCVVIVDDDNAIVGTRITKSTGTFSTLGFAPGRFVDWLFHEGKADTGNPPTTSSRALDRQPIFFEPGSRAVEGCAQFRRRAAVRRTQSDVEAPSSGAPLSCTHLIC